MARAIVAKVSNKKRKTVVLAHCFRYGGDGADVQDAAKHVPPMLQLLLGGEGKPFAKDHDLMVDDDDPPSGKCGDCEDELKDVYDCVIQGLVTRSPDDDTVLIVPITIYHGENAIIRPLDPPSVPLARKYQLASKVAEYIVKVWPKVCEVEQ
jgi:hypothetical protein